MVMVVLLQSSYFSLLKSFFRQSLSHKTKEQQCRTKFDVHIHFVSMFSMHFQFMIKFFVPDKFNLRENRKVSSDHSGKLLIYKSGCKLILKFEHINLCQEASCYFLTITIKSIIAVYF